MLLQASELEHRESSHALFRMQVCCLMYVVLFEGSYILGEIGCRFVEWGQRCNDITMTFAIRTFGS